MDAPRLLEVMPTFNKEEKLRFLQLTSLNFNEFINYPPEKFNLMPLADRSALFKGRRVLESCLERIQRLGTSNPKYKTLYFKTMSKWGHIALLAQDWVAAVSSYQEAYKCNPDEFWKEPGCYFGLGLCYLHFKDFKLAADAFQRVLYSFPTLECIAEVKARLGLCHQNLSNYDQALKYYNQAMADLKESHMLPKIHIRFNIALTKENSGQLTHAEMEYKHILTDLMDLVNARQGGHTTPEQVKLYAALNRQLGWVSYRQQSSSHAYITAEERGRRLGDAENFLKQAQQIEPLNGRTYYFFGRCYGELPTKAHDAFINYRHSIDKSEADADTWCSIGWLYQQQNQPIDALQAFVCAVELDAQHSAAWTDLGQLYEINHQFEDALNCYKQAVKFNPVAPEALKARISVLEKELNTSNQFLAQRNTPQPQRKLTSLKDAWHLPIPSELRQRQDEFLKVKQQRYRDGSPLWRMGDLAAPLIGTQEIPGLPPMDSQQVQMMRLLQMNRDRLNSNERQLLREMEQRDRECQEACYDSFYPQNVHIASKLPTFTEEDFQSLKGGNHIKTEVKLEQEEESNEADTKDSERNSNDRVVQDGQVTSTTDLPTTFCLDSKLHVPLDISSTELLDLCTKRVERISDFKPVFDETAAPPRPPTPPPRDDVKPQSGQNPLLKPTPLVVVESRKDAQSPELQRFVESTPIALIRGLTAVLKMDLSLFSTKTLRDTAPETEVEVRTQYKMPCDLNVDHLGVPSWECASTKSFTTVSKYSLYQADSFQHSLKEEAEKLRTAGAKYAQQIAEADAKKRRRGPNGEEWAMPMKSIKFGTNVDLSDETKWKPQLQELSKMPPFCRLIAGCNMLSHLGHTVLGMNTVQLYMKVPGSRTPAHQENNCFASININIGPGDCEWFGVPNEYWGQINTMCKKRNIDFLKGSYWPNVEDLLDEGIPVYRFTQKAGDLVWVGGGCVHWVQATGWCNNIAWNVGPITYQQLSLSVSSYEWNKLQGYKSLVPMQHLCWQLAKNVRFTNQKVFTLVRGVLIRSLAFCKMVSDWALAQGKQLKSQPRQKNEITHYCTLCEIEVFNVLFVKEKDGKFPVFCVYCTRRSGLTKDYIVLQQIPLNDLKKIFDEMQMNHIPKAALVC